ncbi:hypothetical protein Nepgr_033745 [Nepenthes gracilis]|uniref:Secreted protein n=1 Tax=Nepenthes gracilis TaxID=150966 RepID=A0AAD3TMF3_NEPGR|nr:hypothetical protein Nepgr_033745 [Nepenthes gracilis]
MVIISRLILQRLASALCAMASDLYCPCKMMRIHGTHLSVYILILDRCCPRHSKILVVPWSQVAPYVLPSFLVPSAQAGPGRFPGLLCVFANVAHLSYVMLWIAEM